MSATTIYADPRDARASALQRRRAEVLPPAYKLFYEQPVHLVRGLGTRVWDAEGNEFLDAYNNVPVVGHAHPAVIEAVRRQSEQINAHTRYLDEGVVAYSEELLGLFPEHLDRVMYTCTGSEANDLALRIARAATGATGVLVTANAYHGVSDLTASCSPSLLGVEGLAPEVVAIAPPGDGDFGDSVKAGIAVLADRGLRPAALLADTIFSSDGVHSSVHGFGAAVEAVREAGGLFIADEVQAGFGRLGTAFWGFAHHGVVPDLATLGKPMGNGYPVAAVVASSAAMAAFAAVSRYFNTFGGSSVAIAAAAATLGVIRNEGLVEHAALVGEQTRAMVAAVAGVLEVRGSGLFIGARLAGADQAIGAANRLRRTGVLVSVTGPASDVLKIRPPLPFDAADATLLAGRLAGALSTPDDRGTR